MESNRSTECGVRIADEKITKTGLPFILPFSLSLLAACTPEPVALPAPFINNCKQPELRARYEEKLLPENNPEEIVLPVVLHVVVMDETEQQAYWNRQTANDAAYESTYIDKLNQELAGQWMFNDSLTQMKRDTHIRVALDNIDVMVYGEWSLITEADQTKSVANEMKADNNRDGVLNIYVITGNLEITAEELKGKGSTLMGFAPLPGAQYPGLVLFDQSAKFHELGHALGLYHTFETVNGDSLKDPLNCFQNGDFLCSTPPDPGPEHCHYSSNSAHPEIMYYMTCDEGYEKWANTDLASDTMAYYAGLYTGLSQDAIVRAYCSASEYPNAILTDEFEGADESSEPVHGF